MQNHAVLINGEHSNAISSNDRGLLYGDGVFETIAIKNGTADYWEDHIERLQIGCATLGLQHIDENKLTAELKQLLNDDAPTERCVIKIIITRGAGNRGYKPDSQAQATRILQKFPWPEYPSSFSKQGIKVTLCDFRLSHQSKLAQIKHLNRLEQVMARGEWDEEFQEGLVCDHDENIIEATSSNVFFQLKETLVTPDLSKCGVAGILRKKIIEYCNDNEINIEIREFNLKEASEIQAMFVCNSINGLWPVSSFCGRKLDKTAIIDQLTSVFNR